MPAPQQVLLSYVMPDGSTGSVYLDASVNEQHGVQAQVTEHQVESGPNITDYIRPMPRRLSIEGVVTNTPIATPLSQTRGVTGASSTARGQSGITWTALQFTGGELDRVRDVYGILVDAAQAGAIFSIVTTLENYESFAITNFAVPRNAANSNAIQFTVDFQEIRVVTTQTVAALPAKIQKTSRGVRAPKPVEDSDQKAADSRTALKRLVGFAGL